MKKTKHSQENKTMELPTIPKDFSNLIDFNNLEDFDKEMLKGYEQESKSIEEAKTKLLMNVYYSKYGDFLDYCLPLIKRYIIPEEKYDEYIKKDNLIGIIKNFHEYNLTRNAMVLYVFLANEIPYSFTFCHKEETEYERSVLTPDGRSKIIWGDVPHYMLCPQHFMKVIERIRNCKNNNPKKELLPILNDIRLNSKKLRAALKELKRSNLLLTKTKEQLNQKDEKRNKNRPTKYLVLNIDPLINEEQNHKDSHKDNEEEFGLTNHINLFGDRQRTSRNDKQIREEWTSLLLDAYKLFIPQK